MVVKKVEEEDSEFISSQGHTKFLSIYRRIIDEKDQKNGRNDLVKLKLKRRNHNETGRRI